MIAFGIDPDITPLRKYEVSNFIYRGCYLKVFTDFTGPLLTKFIKA